MFCRPSDSESPVPALANPCRARATPRRRGRAPLPLLALAGVLLLAGCANPWPAGDPGARPLVSSRQSALVRGRDHLAAGRYGLAIAAFRDAMKTKPNSVAALNGLAVAYDHIGRYELAADLYARALALDPGSARTLNNIGFSHMLQGKFDLAVVFLRDAQQRDRDNPAIAANRTVAEAALRASQPRPGAQWQSPLDKDVRPLPRAWVERTTAVVQTLVAQPVLASASADSAGPPVLNRPARRAPADTLPGMLAAPIGDTRLAAERDRLPRPLADTWTVNLPATTSGGDSDEPPG